jgi:hypothetical protein
MAAAFRARLKVDDADPTETVGLRIASETVE